MRYVNISAHKTVPVTILVVVLLLCTTLTFSWKNITYGTTPFFSSVRLLAEEYVIYGLFSLRHYSSRLISAVAGSVSYPSKEASGRSALAVPVLTYHRLAVTDDSANVTIGNFMDQMQTLYENGWRTVTLEEYQAFMRGKIELPEKSFLITFDDGAQQSAYHTNPILKMLDFTAVQYIIVAASEAQGSSYYLSTTQIKNLLTNGHWEIGSHSYDAHRPYPTDAQGGTGTFYADKLWLAEEGRLETGAEFTQRVRDDLRASKQRLEETYGMPITTFAFPFGAEAGINIAYNFPEGESITIAEASRVYDLGWIQSERKDYTFNYRAYQSFLHERIHVDYDWDGAKLVSVMENGIPKSLPFTDDMSVDRGWQQSWGTVRAGGILLLQSDEGESSASTILDGTRLWETYETEASVTWDRGYAFILGSATDDRTYRSCVFANGSVQIQDTHAEETVVLERANNESIRYGTDVRLGMRIEPSAITCLYNGTPVLTAQGVASRQGGIGMQTWSPALGQAELTVTNLSVKPQ